MKTTMRNALGAGWLALFLAASGAQATPYGFVNITMGTPDVAGQLSVDVTEAGAHQVLFSFYNSGPIDATITEIYFDDGTLLGIAEIFSGSGVSFSQGGRNGVNPANLPGGQNIIPAFNATELFSAEADGNNSTGVDPGEWVAILFDLINEKTYEDTIDALADGTLRIGLHVRSIGPEGISDSFVNNGPIRSVPDAGSGAVLMGLALVGLQAFRRKWLK